MWVHSRGRTRPPLFTGLADCTGRANEFWLFDFGRWLARRDGVGDGTHGPRGEHWCACTEILDSTRYYCKGLLSECQTQGNVISLSSFVSRLC